MHVDTIQKRYKNKVYTYTLVRQTYRQGGKVRHRTLANLSALPDEVIELVRRALRGEQLVPVHEAFRIARKKPRCGLGGVRDHKAA